MQYHSSTCVAIICSIIYQHIYFLYAAQFTDMSSCHIQHHLSMYIFAICCMICQQWQTLYYVNRRHLYKIYWFLELLWRKLLTFCDFLSSWEMQQQWWLFEWSNCNKTTLWICLKVAAVVTVWKRLRVLFKAAVTTMFDDDIKVFINMNKSWISAQTA